MVEYFECEQCGTQVSENAYRTKNSCPTCGNAIPIFDKKIALEKLSNEAQALLKAASQGKDCIIINLPDEVKTNGKNFITDDKPRTIALWHGVVDELENNGCIKHRGHVREIFDITTKGYELADLMRGVPEMHENEPPKAMQREKRLQDQMVNPVTVFEGLNHRSGPRDMSEPGVGLPTIIKKNKSNTAQVPESNLKEKDQVFIVHGRDDATKTIIAQFLKELVLRPIILHEQANKGRTIIEKFEDHSSDVTYAVILLTPDDLGGLISEPTKLSPRARQNVVFEMGHFFGRLGRGKVCALLSPGVERPSDIDGILHIPLDQGGEWKGKLLLELKAAGLKVEQGIGSSGTNSDWNDMAINDQRYHSAKGFFDVISTPDPDNAYSTLDKQKLDQLNYALKTDHQRLALLTFLHTTAKSDGNDIIQDSQTIKKFANIMAQENNLKPIQDIGGVLTGFTQDGEKKNLGLLRKGRPVAGGSNYSMNAEWLPYLRRVQQGLKWECSWLKF